MFDLDRWQEVFNALKSNKLRTFLTAFGIFWGIFMLLIMLGAGKGLKNGVYDGMGDFATNSVFIWSQQTTMPYKGLPKGRYYEFNNDDTKALRQSIPEIELLSPRIRVREWEGEGVNKVVRGLKSGAYNIFGDYPEYNKIDPVRFVYGRFLNDFDIIDQRKVVVIGNRVYEELFKKDENPLGEYLKVRGVYFKVIGVFKSKHTGGWGEWQEQCIFLPFTTLQKTYNYGSKVGWYSITSKSNISASVVEKKVKDLLKKRHNVHPDDEEATGCDNVEEEFKKMNGLFLAINFLIWIVGSGTLAAGVIGVSNIMLVIVKERTKEIGIQRAIGAKPIKIIGQILTESVVLTSIAGSIGMVIGVAIIELVNKALQGNSDGNMMFKDPEIDFKVALVAIFVLLVSGIIAGLIPAKRAVSIKPIDAIREE